MSWTIDGGTPGDVKALQDSIMKQLAGKKRPLMFCAAKDEGQKQAEITYPYNCDPTAFSRIGASDQFGAGLPYVSEATYLFPGQGISNLAWDDTTEQLEGSSQATALAAGLAALILTCEGMTKKTNGILEMRSMDNIKAIFDRLSTKHPSTNIKSVGLQVFEDAVKYSSDPTRRSDPVAARTKYVSEQFWLWIKADLKQKPASSLPMSRTASTSRLGFRGYSDISI